MTGPIRIATRGSELALWQAHFVEAAIRQAWPAVEVELVVIRTTGDRITDVPLARIGDRGLFTKEIDGALLDGTADIAVHSLKDVPTRVPDGLVIAAVGEREDPRDALLLPDAAPGSLAGLPAGSRVGTSSLRRRAQLAALRPDLEVVDLRGNLNTRVAKLDARECDAIILAAAGVRRLGWSNRVAELLDSGGWLPAVGQGALAIVARERDGDARALLAPLHHAETAACVEAERVFLRELEGGCQIPIGAIASVEGQRLSLAGLVASVDGSRVLRAGSVGPRSDPGSVGRAVAAELRAAGADEILHEIRADSAEPVTPP